MTLVAFPSGLMWPIARPTIFAQGTVATLDATAEKAAHIGRVYWAGRAASKTIDTSGSSAILWQGGATAVYDNAASTLDVGIQGISTSGPIALPDGSFSVKATITTAADATPTLTTINSFHSILPTTGTVTLSHGDPVAVVWDFTNRAGSDSILVQNTIINVPGSFFPTTNANVAAAWQTTQAVGAGNMPNVVLTASDGTLGWIDGTLFLGLSSNVVWTDATNPDERGMIFQVPFDCKVDALWTMMRSVDGTSDFTLKLYELPESAPNALATVTVNAAQTGVAANEGTAIFNFAEVSLSKATDYCVAIKATGAGNVRISATTLGAAGHRAIWPGGTTMRSVSRDGGSGNFGSSSTLLHYPMGVRISSVDDGTGSGSAAVGVIGS